MSGYESNPYWYKKKENEAHEPVWAQVQKVRDDQKYVEEDHKRHLQQYSQRVYEGLSPEGQLTPVAADQRIRLNLTKSAIDTIAARIVPQKPRPMFVTQGGKWSQRNKARKLQKFVEGIFYESKVYDQAILAFKDAAIFGTGYLKVYVEKDRIRVERVFPFEVVVDECTSLGNGFPASFFQRKWVDRDVLKGMFPDKSDYIDSEVPYASGARVATNQVEVLEAWHVDSGNDDGRHVICVKGHTLVDEGWEYKTPPFVVLRWNQMPVGFYGQGAAEDLYGLQKEIMYVMRKIQDGIHVCANAYLLKPVSDQTPNTQFTNQAGIVIEYEGATPPQLVVSPGMHQQVYEWLWKLYSVGFEDAGVSQLSATSKKPAGIESGIALQTLLDSESQRFAVLQLAWERFFVDLANLVVEFARTQYSGRKEKTEYEVKYDAGRFVECIKWSDVNIPEDEYILKVWPTNLLPQSPAGKIDMVEKMLAMGTIDAQQALMLLDFPDVEAMQTLNLAAVRSAYWIVDQVLYEDNYIIPKAYQPLELGIKYMQMAAMNAEMEGAPYEVIEKCMNWVVDAQDLMAGPSLPPPTQPMPQPMDPGQTLGWAPGAPAPGNGAPPMPPEMMGGLPGGAVPPQMPPQ